nr:IclR family transcriptional regulator [Corynebacterium sp. c6VSa_13]
MDRAVAIMTAIAQKPRNLAELCADTELPRATAHRLATALEVHRLLARTSDGRWAIGPTMAAFGAGAKNQLIDAATPIMSDLMEATTNSVQLYQLTGAFRTCVAAQEPASGLRNTVPVGSRMPLTAGSAARVFLAYGPPELAQNTLPDAAFDAAELDLVRQRGWAESVEEREVGLASLSTPVFDSEGTFLAALSISGVAERLKPSPGARWAPQLLDAAARLSAAL